MAFDNVAFFINVIKIYPVNIKNIGFLLSLIWGFTSVIIILLTLVCYKSTIKPISITILFISSFTSYFMDSYNVVIDDTMIENIISTDITESLDLFSARLVLYISLLAVIPSYFIYQADITFNSGWQAVLPKLKTIGLALFSTLLVVFIFSDFYSSFIREHKPLRYYSNPSYYIFSLGKFVNSQFNTTTRRLTKIGLDASIPTNNAKRKLIIFVVGETARADRFSLNGYTRETNPLLKQEAIISFNNFWSCGTSTATSVPCLFSNITASHYKKEIVRSTENALDVLNRAGVNVIWLDNNSDSKGVALRVPYQSYKDSSINPICTPECRDEGMLTNLQTYIDTQPTNDILIILHQMGNHGPAYYKRYPSEFEKFTPVCKTNQLEDCSNEALNNAYDNAILYTDYFLAKTIALLKTNNADFATALFYVSDHGESLGENGLYLHGLPHFIAPDTQTHVPAIIWFGDNFDAINRTQLLKQQNEKYSHDHIFHTLLGLFKIKSSVYDPKMDIL